MENEPLKLYTHVMIDIHGENIRFGTDQNFHIGISLFDFIEHMTSHPYFSQKIEGKFQELLKDMPAGQMIELQNTYRALIDAAAEAEDYTYIYSGGDGLYGPLQMYCRSRHYI